MPSSSAGFDSGFICPELCVRQSRPDQTAVCCTYGCVCLLVPLSVCLCLCVCVTLGRVIFKMLPHDDLDPTRAHTLSSSSGLRVPFLCLGTSGLGNIGGRVTDAAAAATVDEAVAAATRTAAFIETAPAYGLGLAERRVGLALSHSPPSAYILQTKVGASLRPRPVPKVGASLSNGLSLPFCKMAPTN